MVMNTPVIVGAAQYTWDKENTDYPDPASEMTKVAELALESTNNLKLKDYIDTLFMINIKSWSYRDAPSILETKLGLNLKKKVYLSDGGNTPQMLINRAAKTITEGEAEAILITGAEAAYSAYQTRKGRIEVNWPKFRRPRNMEGEIWASINGFEDKYQIILPSYAYALFETAIRHHKGSSLEEHREYMGKLFERFSKVAAKNPYSWTKQAYSAKEIVTPTEENRLINHPYTKRMCSNMYVNQAGAMIITHEDLAKKLSINESYWVYPQGGADLDNIFELTRRPHFYESHAARSAAELALERAGLTIDDIDKFDLYSCFPSMVQMLKNEIGIDDEDPREITLCGGLPYYGGPWSTYSFIAAIEAVNAIQKDPSLHIMVVANGGLNSKESVGIYGKEPPAISWAEKDDSKKQEEIYAEELPEPTREAEGNMTIEAYTIVYDRDGNPQRGIMVGKLANGSRTLAMMKGDKEKLAELSNQELVGKTFKVHHDEKSGFNIIKV